MPWWRGRDRRGPRAAILVPSLASDDAVGHDTQGLAEAIGRLGFRVSVFAGSAAPGVDALPLERAWRFVARRADLILYQQSTGWPAGERLLARARGTIVVRDHDVTPSCFLARSRSELRREVAEGERARARLARDARVDAYWATSRATARGLAGLGADPGRIAVVPPSAGVERLEAVAPDRAALRRFALRPATALFVGRVAPNKGISRMQRVAARYRELFGEPLRVRIVGRLDPRHAAYHRELERERAALGIAATFHLLGELSLAELKAAYLTSRLFLCCSEHEGFCVPLVEAARLGLPVVAAEQEAVAETLGPGAMVLPFDDVALAVAVRRVLSEDALRDRLVERQRRQAIERFGRRALERAVEAALARLDRRRSAA